jgi:hypothetical protein
LQSPFILLLADVSDRIGTDDSSPSFGDSLQLLFRAIKSVNITRKSYYQLNILRRQKKNTRLKQNIKMKQNKLQPVCNWFIHQLQPECNTTWFATGLQKLTVATRLQPRTNYN